MKPVRLLLFASVFAISACSVFGGGDPPPPTEPPVDTAATEAAIAAQVDAAVQATAAAQAAIDAQAAELAAAAEATAQAVAEPTSEPEPAAPGNIIAGGNYILPGACAASTFLSVSADPANSAYPAPVLNVACDDTTVTVNTNGIPNFEFVATGSGTLQAIDQIYKFPVSPSVADSTAPLPLLDPIAVAVNGMPIFGPNEGEAQGYRDPVLSDLLDFCNGHTEQGLYHVHAAPDCLFTDLNNSPGLVVGWAFDGFPIVAPVVCDDAACASFRGVDSTWERTNPDAESAWDQHSVVPEKSALDECNGLMLDDGNYVYFATASFPYFLGCYRGVATENKLPPRGAGAGAGAGGNGGNGSTPPNFAAAAGALGISEEDFRNAVGLPPFDIDAIVSILNVDRDTLIDALVIGGFPVPGLGGGGAAAACDGPNFAAAAAVLGITEEALRTAMTVTPLDLAVAANTLGITQDALIAASIANCLPLPAGLGTNLIPQGAGGLIPQVGGGDN